MRNTSLDLKECDRFYVMALNPPNDTMLFPSHYIFFVEELPKLVSARVLYSILLNKVIDYESALYCTEKWLKMELFDITQDFA